MEVEPPYQYHPKGWYRYKEEKRIIKIIMLIIIVLIVCHDLIIFYITYELILVPLIILIIRNKNYKENLKWEIKKDEATYSMWVYTLVSTIIMIPIIIDIYKKEGSLDSEILINNLNEKKYYIIIFLLFMVKIPMWPLHSWLPLAHVEASTKGSMILAGIVIKLGMYGIYKYHYGIYGINKYTKIIISLGVISIIYSNLIVLSLIDIKKIIAYSSIIHMNLGILFIYLKGSNGVISALVNNISHALVSCSLFLSIGIIYERLHNKFILNINGISLLAPILSWYYLINNLFNMSLPLSLNAISEIIGSINIMNKNHIIYIVVCVSIFLNSIYSIYIINRVLYGNINKKIEGFNDLNINEYFILAFLFFLSLLFGIYPDPLLSLFVLCP